MNGLCGKTRLFLFMCLLAAAGCASSTAVHKNLGLLQPGVPRQAIIAEFGEPLITLAADNITTDIYGFYQGFAGLNRYLCAGLPDVYVSTPYEPDIEVHPEPFRESEPEIEAEREEWYRRKQRHEWDEINRCNSINSYNAEAIAAQKVRRAEALRDANQQRLQQIEMLALDQVPGFPGIGLSNPYDRPGSAGIVVFAVTYDETMRAKLFDIARGQKLVDQARKKRSSWFAAKPAALPSSEFFKIALEHPRAKVRSTTLSKITAEY